MAGARRVNVDDRAPALELRDKVAVVRPAFPQHLADAGEQRAIVSAERFGLAFAFRLATGRRPESKEIRVLSNALAQLRTDFIAHGSDAYAFVKTGASPMDPLLPPAELAAATAVASMIHSLDETITKN